MFASEMLTTLLLLLGVAVLTREMALFLLALALLVAAALSRLWEWRCLVGVEYRRRFSHRRAYYGEEVELEIEVVNRKLLPLSWLELEEEIPEDLPPTHGRTHPSHKPGRVLLASLFALRPYERVRRRYRLPCLVRGEHLFGPVLVRSGDLFGFSTRERTIETVDTLVVCPRVVPLARLGLPARHPLGDLRAQSWLFEDVSRITGAREYRPGDGLRRIHWPASARAQQLQSRAYEATTSHKLGILLNLATDEGLWFGYGYDPEVLELGITAAASLAQWGLEQGYQVGVYTNGMHRLSRGNVVVEPGRGVGHLERILVALGRLQPVAVQRFEVLLAEEGSRLPYGTTAVVVTAALLPPVAAAVRALHARGHAVTAILTGRKGVGASLDRITVRRVGPPEGWREMTVL